MKLPTQHEPSGSSGAPRYAHHCPMCGECTWLGQVGFYDLYACRRPSLRGVVLVARYGVMSHDLATFALGMFRGEPKDLASPFDVAYELAVKKGVVTP